MSRELMAGKEIRERRTLEPDETLVKQGAPGDELYLVLDGVLAVDVDGNEVAEIESSAIVGEKTLLEGACVGRFARTAPCRLRVIPGGLIDLQELAYSPLRGGEPRSVAVNGGA